MVPGLVFVPRPDDPDDLTTFVGPLIAPIIAMSFFTHLVERLPEAIQRTEDTIIGLFFQYVLPYFSGILTYSLFRDFGAEQ